MERQSVSSSTISSIGYDISSMTLEIEFKNGGIYQYQSVPEEVFQSLISARSHGTYLHDHIKDKYQYSKI